MGYIYNVYNLNVQSSIFFPELKKSSENKIPDIIIRFEDLDHNHHSLNFKKINNGGLWEIQHNDKKSIFFWENELIFKVENGKEIIVNIKSTINKSFLRSLILTQAMGILLHQRGYLVLHGSSVKMNNNAVVFIGESGNGKSTITVALNNKGYPLITDDVSAITFKENIPIIFPSFPRIKLWVDIIKNLTYDKDLTIKIRPDLEKYSYPIEECFHPDPVPLKRIYLIEKGKKNEIINLNNKDALINLIRNSYNFKIFGISEKSYNLFQCSNLINNVSLKNLKVHHSVKEIDDLINLIENDVY